MVDGESVKVKDVRKIAELVREQNGNKDYSTKEILYYLTHSVEDLKDSIEKLDDKMETQYVYSSKLGSRISNIEGQFKALACVFGIGVPILVALVMFIFQRLL